jgi:soluble lytic murein transglycosylase
VLTDLVASYRQQPHDLLDLAREASAVGLHDVALIASVSLLSRLSPQQRLETPFTVEQLAYPAPYPEAVLEAARAEGIPPLLLLALVRQESAFNPAALSIADARGLTQVIPATGRAIADSLGVEWDAADLLKADRSLRFGAHYLAMQLDRFDGNVLTALAAYNGGPQNAARWLEEQTWPGADGYIHAVGFSETRRYIERVLENYAWYRYLYAGASRPAIR